MNKKFLSTILCFMITFVIIFGLITWTRTEKNVNISVTIVSAYAEGPTIHVTAIDKEGNTYKYDVANVSDNVFNVVPGAGDSIPIEKAPLYKVNN